MTSLIFREVPPEFTGEMAKAYRSIPLNAEQERIGGITRDEALSIWSSQIKAEAFSKVKNALGIIDVKAIDPLDDPVVAKGSLPKSPKITVIDHSDVATLTGVMNGEDKPMVEEGQYKGEFWTAIRDNMGLILGVIGAGIGVRYLLSNGDRRNVIQPVRSALPLRRHRSDDDDVRYEILEG